MDDHSQDGATDPLSRGGPLGDGGVALTPSLETVFDVLADEDRREICRFLVSEAPDVVTVDGITNALTETEAERERLALHCHHQHLPKLDEAGLIEYDPRSNAVRYWGQPTLEKWLDHARHVDDRPEPEA